MHLRVAILTAAAAVVSGFSVAADLILPRELLSRPQYPEVSDSGYVLIEVWPVVRHITLVVYFLDALDVRSQRLCEATKRSLDRNARALAREQNRTSTSYRLCMTIKDAVHLGYIDTKNTSDG